MPRFKGKWTSPATLAGLKRTCCPGAQTSQRWQYGSLHRLPPIPAEVLAKDGFACSFLILLGVRLRPRVLVSWGGLACITINFPHRTAFAVRSLFPFSLVSNVFLFDFFSDSLVMISILFILSVSVFLQLFFFSLFIFRQRLDLNYSHHKKEEVIMWQ